MAEAQEDDPFDWEIDRVVQELCSPNRSWSPAPRAQLPDPQQLAIKIRDAGYDGQVLLISLDDEADLWSDLSITATKFKQSVRTAIRQFRNRSRKFKEYQQSLNEDLAITSNPEKPSSSSPGLTEVSVNQLVNGHEKVHDRPQNGTRALQEQNDTGEPPKKKPRRLGTLDLISVERPTRNTTFSAIPTEADTITLHAIGKQSAQADEESMNENGNYNSSLEKLFSKQGAFWGEGKLSPSDIVELDPEATDDSKTFSWGQSWPLGSGRKIHVNCRMKRYLGRHTQPETTQYTDTGDDLLPLYGESPEDYLDPDQASIDREIAEEEDEIRREKARLEKSELQPDAVDACLTQMLDEYTTHWRETKLPGLQRKAYGMWTRARKEGNRHSQIREFSNDIRSLQKRLDAVLNGLKENVYSRETELRRMGPVLEPPTYEIQKKKWSIEILASTSAPEKISLPRTAVPKKAKLDLQDDGLDIWSEDETDGFDDFIVDDSSSLCGQDETQVDGDHVTTNHVTTNHVTGLHTEIPPISEVGQSFASTTSDDVVIHDLTGTDNDLVELPTSSEPRHRSSESGDQFLLSDIRDIVNKGTEHWELLRDGPRLVLTMIHNWSSKRQEKIFRPVNSSDNSEQVWNETIEPAIAFQSASPTVTPEKSKSRARRENAVRLAKLFDIFVGSELTTADKFKKLDQESIARIGQRKNLFDHFWHFLRRIAPWFLEKPDESEIESSFANDEDPGLTPAQKKKRRQANASRIQKHDTQDSQAQQARRILLRQKLQDSTVISGEKRRLIINESKLENQGLVFIHDNIAPRIKDHQIDGVRFMWDQITRGTGCLLAHTMGLGKTMQVITLLTAIAEAATSEDETISVQIPEHLRDLKTLILCPAGILNNWIDELLIWAPEGILGRIRSLSAETTPDDRQDITRDWAATGGVLVIGYGLLSSMKDKNEDLLKLLLESPSLVVSDEAHYLKNASSKRGEIAGLIKTRSRIALTGSPLANNVNEYYSMINWVAPGFLGKKEDFSSKYANPIKDGLWGQSHASERRRARILLAALKKVVSPKVHRRTINVLKESLPGKKEFILYLDLFPIQKKVYQAYMSGVLDTENHITQTTVWGMAASLRELLAHPSIFHRRLNHKKHKGHGQDKDDNYKEPAEMLTNMLELLGPKRSFDSIGVSYKMLVLDKILEEAMKLGENVLIFSQSLSTLDYIEWNLCRKKQMVYKRLDGRTAAGLRQGMVKEFNRNISQAFLISTTAGGIGLNIYGANRVVIMDFQYNPVDEQQSIGRAYRIGQTKEVFVYWLICDGTFEQTLHQHQVFKTQLSSRVVDAKHPLPMADRELLGWFKDFRETPHKDTSGHRGKDIILDSLLDTEAICCGISSVDTTETFEQEEDDKVLSVNDQIEADRLVAEQGLSGKAISAPGSQPSYHHAFSGSARSTPLPVQAPFAPIPQQAPPMVAQTLSYTQQPHTVGPINSPSPNPPNIGIPGVTNIGLPSQTIPARYGLSGQVGVEQQFQQPSPSLPVSLDGYQHPLTDHAVPFSTIGEQRPNTTPIHDVPQPIIMNAQQRTHVKLTKEPARDKLKKKLMEICPLAAGRVDQVLQDLDGLPGGLQKQKVLDDLFSIISDNTACAVALIDGRIPAQALTKAGITTRDRLKELMLGMLRERDPDV